MYALNLNENGRILSSTFKEFASKDMVLVENLPEGDISNYIYNKDGTFTYDPLPEEELNPKNTTLDYIIDHEDRLVLLEHKFLNLYNEVNNSGS